MNSSRLAGRDKVALKKKKEKTEEKKEKFCFNAFDGKPEIPSFAQVQFTLKSFCLKKSFGEEEKKFLIAQPNLISLSKCPDA